MPAFQAVGVRFWALGVTSLDLVVQAAFKVVWAVLGLWQPQAQHAIQIICVVK